MARDASGHASVVYLFSTYLNMSHTEAARTGDTIFYSSYDNYLRKNDAAGMRASMNVMNRAGDTMSGRLTITGGQPASTGIGTCCTTIYGGLELQSQGSAGTAGAAMMALHRPGAFLTYFGLDTDNVLKVGGWSHGTNAYKIWHEGTDGAGSGLDADLLDNISSAEFLRKNDHNHMGYGYGIRFGHGTQTDGNDGWIAAGMFGSGLNIVGTQTSGGTGRQLRIWGNTFLEGGNMTAVAYLHSSDRRLKDDIVAIDGPRALEMVDALTGVHFEWKDTGRDSYGFIAQEVEKIMPEAVVTDTQTGMKSVDYDQVIPVLLQAIKAQEQRIKALEAANAR
jgi:hypothetical protein